MSSYLSFALGTALIVGVGLIVLRRPADPLMDDEIAWL